MQGRINIPILETRFMSGVREEEDNSNVYKSGILAIRALGNTFLHVAILSLTASQIVARNPAVSQNLHYMRALDSFWLPHRLHAICRARGYRGGMTAAFYRGGTAGTESNHKSFDRQQRLLCTGQGCW